MANGRTESVKPGEHSTERSTEQTHVSGKNLNAGELLAKGGAALAANDQRQDAAGNKVLAALGNVQFTDSGNDKSASAAVDSPPSSTQAATSTTELKDLLSKVNKGEQPQVIEPLARVDAPLDPAVKFDNPKNAITNAVDVLPPGIEPFTKVDAPLDPGVVAAARAQVEKDQSTIHDQKHSDTKVNPSKPETQHPLEAHPKPESKQPSDRHDSYTIQKGDSLWKIAQKHLGEHAKSADIWAYIRKTAELNGIKNERLIAAGATLRLPNENDLHGTKSAGDSKPAVKRGEDPGKPDATIVPKTDATVPHKPDATIAPKTDATVPHTPDATIAPKADATVPHKPDATIAPKTDATTVPKDDSSKVLGDKTADQTLTVREQQHIAQKEHLNALLDAQVKSGHMDAAQEGRIKDNITTFEKQSKNLEDLYQKQIHADNPNMPPEQVANRAHDRAQKELTETYKQVSELFEKQSTVPGMTDQLQHKLAEQILYNAGHVKDLDQGCHNSCELMSGEKRTYMRSPSQAARLVKDAALTGQYETTHSNLIVPIDGNSLLPHDEARGNTPQDNQRDYASQVFQVVEANVYYKHENIPIQYQQGEKGAQPACDSQGHRLPRFNDTGERQYNTQTHQYERSPSGNFDCTPGNAGSNHALNIMDAEINYKPEETPRSNFCFGGPYEDWGMQSSHSPRELADRMKAALDRGDGPLCLSIKTANPPINQNPGGGHELTVDSYTAAQSPGELPMFNLDNQWGKINDHKYDSAYNLYRLTGTPGQPMPGIPNDGGRSEFENDAKQIEQLQSMHMHGQISDHDYQDALRQQVLALSTQFKSKAAPDQKSWSALGVALQGALSNLPPGLRTYVTDPNENAAAMNDNH